MFLGEDILAWMVLAIGGAMAAGNLAALLFPPRKKHNKKDLPRVPLVRCMLFVIIGAVSSVWAFVSLLV
ncbi:MAG: hypothetical protein OXI96_01335 [Acidimicrobiaceae bacterium]|nr:hypothetical protein [Acidimicrobiaceae bacterium]